MKIDEFVNEANRNSEIGADDNDGVISIFADTGDLLIDVPEGATNFLEVSWYNVNPVNYFSKRTREYLSALIEEFLETPINERFPEKKWLLCLGKNGCGQKIYLTKTDDSRKIETTMNADCFTIWSDQEIQDLMKYFPNLAPVINYMKEEVKDNAC